MKTIIIYQSWFFDMFFLRNDHLGNSGKTFQKQLGTIGSELNRVQFENSRVPAYPNIQIGPNVVKWRH